KCCGGKPACLREPARVQHKTEIGGAGGIRGNGKSSIIHPIAGRRCSNKARRITATRSNGSCKRCGSGKSTCIRYSKIMRTDGNAGKGCRSVYSHGCSAAIHHIYKRSCTAARRYSNGSITYTGAGSLCCCGGHQ